jgi:hypothetical protein
MFARPQGPDRRHQWKSRPDRQSPNAPNNENDHEPESTNLRIRNGGSGLSDDGGADNYRPTNRGAAVEEGEDDAAGDEDGRPDVDALGVGRE